MLELGHRPDAKMLSNIAAAQLALEKYVAASSYAGKSVAADPDWWKGHWYKAQSLMKMVRNKPPSTAMGERCEQAARPKQWAVLYFPDAKRAEVEQEHQTKNHHADDQRVQPVVSTAARPWSVPPGRHAPAALSARY